MIIVISVLAIKWIFTAKFLKSRDEAEGMTRIATMLERFF